MAKPRKFYETLNQPKRNPNGPYRRPSPKAHGSAAKQSSGSTGRAKPITLSDWSLRISHTTLYPIFPEPPEPTPIPYAGIRTGELIGYRAWKVVNDCDGPELCSIAHYQVWKPQEIIRGDVNEAVERCGIFNDDIIMGGVYAHLNHELVKEQTKEACLNIYPTRRPKKRLDWFDYGAFGTGTYETYYLLGIVWGTVELWGEVVEHELGYRAEYAKLKSLDSFYGDFDFAKLKERYGV